MFTPQDEPEQGSFSLRGTGLHQIKECRRALFALGEAVKRCPNEDVREECVEALRYLETNCRPYAPVRQFRRALSIQDPVQRWRTCRDLLPKIGRAIPGYYVGKE